MDLIKEALSMGFANAAIMDTKDLVFVPNTDSSARTISAEIITWFLHVRLPAALLRKCRRKQ